VQTAARSRSLPRRVAPKWRIPPLARSRGADAQAHRGGPGPSSGRPEGSERRTTRAGCSLRRKTSTAKPPARALARRASAPSRTSGTRTKASSCLRNQMRRGWVEDQQSRGGVSLGARRSGVRSAPALSQCAARDSPPAPGRALLRGPGSGVAGRSRRDRSAPGAAPGTGGVRATALEQTRRLARPRPPRSRRLPVGDRESEPEGSSGRARARKAESSLLPSLETKPPQAHAFRADVRLLHEADMSGSHPQPPPVPDRFIL
jgi:hypothetical protein